MSWSINLIISFSKLVAVGLISPKRMGLFWLINAIEKLRRWEVAKILHYLWGGVVVVVSAFSVMTEKVGVLQAQVKPLGRQTSC